MRFEKPSRELSVGEILYLTFQLYTSKFVLFFLPFIIAGLIGGIFITALLLSFPLPAPPPPGASLIEVSLWARNLISALIGPVVLGGIVSWIISSIAQGMAIKSASDILEKGGANLQESFGLTISRLGSLLVASLVTDIIILVGTFLLVIPGIIFMIMFSLVLPIVIIEQKGAFDSLGRGNQLVSHRWLNTFAVLLVTGLIVGVISGIVIGIIFPLTFFSLTSSSLGLRMLLSSIVSSFVTPIFSIATTLLYYSMLAKEAGQLPPPPPPV